MREIQSKFVVKFFGVKMIVGTFNKHNPKTIYVDGDIKFTGDRDFDSSVKFGKDLLKCLEVWKESVDDYGDWIKVIKPYDGIFNKYTNTKKKHIGFDMTLAIKQPHITWKEAAKNAKTNLSVLYEDIVELACKNGLKLYGTTKSC